MGETTEHPNLAGIDAVRTGEATPQQARHVAECEKCRPALDELSALAGTLGGLQPKKISVPAEVDRAILDGAGKRIRRPWKRYLLPVSAAAAVLLAVSVTLLLTTGSAPDLAQNKEMMAGRPQDLDGDGRVTILDAFLLARTIQSGRKPNPEWDVNHDGLFNQDDIDQIAATAVSLDGRGD